MLQVGAKGFTNKNELEKFIIQLQTLPEAYQLAAANAAKLEGYQKHQVAAAIGATTATNGQIISTKSLAAAEGEAATATNAYSATLAGLEFRFNQLKAAVVGFLTTHTGVAVALGALAIAFLLVRLHAKSMENALEASAEAHEKYAEEAGKLG